MSEKDIPANGVRADGQGAFVTTPLLEVLKPRMGALGEGEGGRVTTARAMELMRKGEGGAVTVTTAARQVSARPGPKLQGADAQPSAKNKG
jgi:hypothetical protein